LYRLGIHPSWQQQILVRQRFAIVVYLVFVVLFEGFLNVVAVLENYLVAAVVLTFQGECHVL